MGSWEEEKDVLKRFSIKKRNPEPKDTEDQSVHPEKSSSVRNERRKTVPNQIEKF